MEYVETLYRVHQSSFVGEEKGVHDVIHGADGVSVLYQVLGETGFAISVFEVAQVFSEAGVERLLVCPVYFMLQVGKVIWYIPDFSYLLFCGGWWFPIRSAFNVFLVESVTLILVFLKALLLFCSSRIWPRVVFPRCVRVCCNCVWFSGRAGVLYPLLCRIFCIVLSSFCLLSGGSC